MTAGGGVVFVVDDDRSVREAITSLLASVGLRVETFATAHEFLRRPRTEAPACLVLDVRLPGLSGLDLQRELQQTGESMPIVFITGHGDVRSSVRAMKAGAIDFLLKPFTDEALLDAVRRALVRDAKQRESRRRHDEITKRASRLTRREREVCLLVVKGMLNKQIAAAIGTTEKTVKVHRARAMAKMNAESLAQLVRLVDGLVMGDASPPMERNSELAP
jgi:FixJ family two-component response regulator